MTTNMIIGTVITATLLVTSQLASGTGDPILLVPGLTGSRLKVKHIDHSTFPRCNTPRGEVLLWISERRFLTKFNCVSQEMKLNFDRNTSRYSSSDDDITVTVPGFGDTNTVERLSTGLITFPYFEKFVEYFVERGYKRGRNIRAAPYDWRLAPVELQRRGYFDNFKCLIETMYQENTNTKVTIVAHSMGGPTVLHFLTSGIVTQSWKDTYIGSFITLSAAWSGGNRALQAAISGLDFNGKSRRGNTFSVFQFLDEKIENSFTPIIRSLQSTFFLLPRPSLWQNTVLVTTPTQSYTANDYQRLFSDIHFADGYNKFNGIENINQNWPAPNVSTHCFYGVGVHTPLSFYYRIPFPRGARNDPEVTMGDGDGTVNTPSSEVCLKWDDSGYPFNYKTFNNVDHLKIIKDERVLLEVGKVVGALADPLNQPSLLKRIIKWFG